MNPIASWLLAVMVSLIPTTVGEQLRGPNREEGQDRARRYEAIATEMAAVAFDAAEQPVFAGSLGRERTALLLLVTTFAETGWHRMSDLGLPTGQGDRGRDCGLGQVMVGAGGMTQEGWTCEDLIDRRVGLTAALHRIRRSFGACRELGPDGRLVAYVSGSCSQGRPMAMSRGRLALLRRLSARFPPPDSL